mmetsp:Transcript_13495/g.39949  ORF Transcript_13495/g.39949 Transcript_13495/m.39949 type:complete len:271 (+) Transcript_13495:385-1197(+)
MCAHTHRPQTHSHALGAHALTGAAHTHAHTHTRHALHDMQMRGAQGEGDGPEAISAARPHQRLHLGVAPPQSKPAASASRRRDVGVRADPIEEGFLARLGPLDVVLRAQPSARANLLGAALGQVDLQPEDRDGVEIKLEPALSFEPAELAVKLQDRELAEVDAVRDVERRRVEGLHGTDGEVVDLAADLLLGVDRAGGEDESPGTVERSERGARKSAIVRLGGGAALLLQREQRVHHGIGIFSLGRGRRLAEQQRVARRRGQRGVPRLSS